MFGWRWASGAGVHVVIVKTLYNINYDRKLTNIDQENPAQAS